METPFDYTAAREEMDARVAEFLWSNKEVTLREAASLLNMTKRQVEYLAKKHGLRRRGVWVRGK